MTEPTKMKMWRAVRVTPPKVPQTLADCEEGRDAICLSTNGSEVIRRQYRGVVHNTVGDRMPVCAADYPFVCYRCEPQPTALPPPVPKTFGELQDGQCFRLGVSHHTMWRCGSECLWATPIGKIGSNRPAQNEPIIYVPDIEMVLEEQPQ